MDLTLDRTSTTPLYREIVEQIRLLIDSGRLRSGSRMPTVRELASALSLTRLTVHAPTPSCRHRGTSNPSSAAAPLSGGGRAVLVTGRTRWCWDTPSGALTS